MKKSKKKKTFGKSLNERFVEKKFKKATKHGLQLFRCVGGCHMPEGCGYEFAGDNGTATCPRCGNEYCKWLNAPNE